MKYTSFSVKGIPVPKGSATAFKHAKTGNVIIMQSNRAKQKPWASLIALTAQSYFKEPTKGPIELTLDFQMPRPKYHFRSNGWEVKTTAPAEHIIKPDLDKLARCLLDALTGIVYFDDSQVYGLKCRKFYGKYPGVFISVGMEEKAMEEKQIIHRYVSRNRINNIP